MCVVRKEEHKQHLKAQKAQQLGDFAFSKNEEFIINFKFPIKKQTVNKQTIFTLLTGL